jgi:hypothetical protein
VLRIVTATFAVLPATIVAGVEMLTTAALSYGDDGGGSSGGGTAFVPGGSWMSGVKKKSDFYRLPYRYRAMP